MAREQQEAQPASAAAGLMGVRATIAKALMGIKAYHCWPHDFDKFDLTKIGTGEGAQVYGHGLYFAENPAVSGQGGQYWQQFETQFGGAGSSSMRQTLRSEGFRSREARYAARARTSWITRRHPRQCPDAKRCRH